MEWICITELRKSFLNEEDVLPTLIHIYGTARSGSTMLDLMLGNAPDAFSCGEVSALFRPYRRHHFTIDCSCGQNPCSVWEKIAHVPENQFYATVVREVGVSFMIDSSKDLCWLLDAQRWATASRIQTVNLLLWKDPIDLAYSHWKRGRGLAAWRKEFITCYSQFFGTHLPYIAVSYNVLANDPERVLRAICAAVGMEYFAGKERFLEKEHHYLFGSLGVRRQVQGRDSAVKYSPDFPPEFHAKREFLEGQIAKDLAVQEILAILRQADVVSNPAYTNDDRQVWPKDLLPVRLYWKRMVRLLRKYVPEYYDPMAP
jgi:hypothetical protein